MEKRQRAKVGVAGSFINQMMSNNATLPKVGEGATILHYTDRDCCEVISVSEDGKTVKLEHLDAEWDKTKQGDIGHQNWILKPTGRFFTLVWKQNAWRTVSNEIVFTNEFIEQANAKGIYALARALTPEQYQLIYNGDVRPQAVVEGITRMKKTYSKVKILFGVKDYYYDWSF